MLQYRVIRFFTDLQDNDFRYEVGDMFPRRGLEVSTDRIQELASRENKQGIPLISSTPEYETDAEVPAEETVDDEDEVNEEEE